MTQFIRRVRQRLDADSKVKGRRLMLGVRVRSERYKLVSVHGMDVGELYDLENDANETRNLWDAPEAQSIKVVMLKQLSDAMAWTVDPLPERQAIRISSTGTMEV